MDIKKIVETIDWEKRWQSKFHFFSFSYYGEQYFNQDKILGANLDHSVFIRNNGILTIYQSKNENDEFGRHIAKKFDDNPEMAKKMNDDLILKTDEIVEFVNKQPNVFLDPDEYKKFEELFNDFIHYYVPVNRCASYLSESVKDEVLPVLEEARLYSEKVYGIMDKFFMSLISLVSEKENLDLELTETMVYQEFKQYIKNGTLPKLEELKKRVPIAGLYFEGGKGLLMLKDDCLDFEKILTEKLTKDGNEIIGNSACPGKVEGVVKIVFDPDKPGKFNNGDILVCGMTRPEYVVLMKKAGAIVTDAGGVLSHAAIISRELNKPCVIGTQIATRVLRDGDIVEVDATLGIIKKL